MHDYENGHTCPTCHKTGILCTIEDGFCENQGTCNECIKEQVYEEMDREMGYSSWACSHGLYEGEDCPLCEEAKELLNSLNLIGFSLIEKNIYTTRQIHNKYWDKIPVLLKDNKDLCWPFTPEKVKEFILI